MRSAMYAFSGDPITYGHIDIVERAANAFDSVVVGIGVNPAKKYLFSLEERTDMAKRSLAQLPNVDVVPFRGLLVDYAYEHGIGVIVKGVRNATDVEYEKTLHQAGESQKLGIDTHILFAKPELAHVSSSMVKGIQDEHGLIHEYVPLYVKQRLEERISGQYIVGVTGEIGAGKSRVSNRFVQYGNERGIGVHNIELDEIGHQILGTLTEPRYETVRTQIVDAFGAHIQQPDGTIDRKALGDIVFNDPAALDELNMLMATPLSVRIRRELQDKEGLILLNAALVAESDMGYLCNNNVILIHADHASQQRRLMARGLTAAQIERRLDSQYDYAAKRAMIEHAITRDGNGALWTLMNSDGKDETEKAFENVAGTMGIP